MDLDVRVGDTERRAVDARLQAAVGDGVLTLTEYDERAAAVWAARTRRELDEVVKDLAPQHGGPVPAPTGPATPRRSVAVLSGDELAAPFPAGQPLEAYALLGGSKIDLRTADLPAEVHVRAVTVMGGIEILVPRGVTLHLSGGALLGGRECKVDPPVPGAPTVHVEAYALLGSVEVKHGRGKKADVLVRSPAEGEAARGWSGSSWPVPRYGSVPVQGGPPPAPARRRGLDRVRRALGTLALVGAVVGGIAVADTMTDELAIMSSGVEVVRASDDASVRVAAVMGSVTVVVPDDAQVDTGGVRVMSGLTCDVCARPDQTGPAVEVQGWALMGSIEVVTQTEHARGRR